MRSALLACLLASAALARGAELPLARYAIDTWSTADGLPQNSATAIAQTADGYLWVGTFNGLVRFDGSQFTLFDRDNVPGLEDPRIIDLRADRLGRLWVVHQSWGISRLEAGQLQPTRMTGHFRETFEDRAGAIWLFEAHKDFFRWETDHFAEAQLPEGCPTGRGVRLLLDKEDRFWVQTRTELGCIRDQRFVSLRTMERDLNAADAIWPFPSAGAGVWLKSRTGLERLQADGRVTEVVEFPAPAKSCLTGFMEDRQGNLWIDSGSGQLWRRSSGGDWSMLTTDQGLARNIRTFYEDKEGIIWLATDGNGLQRLRPRAFTTFDERHGLPPTFLSSVTEDAQGTLWVGSLRGGLRKWEDDQFAPFERGAFTPGTIVRTVLAGSRETVWSYSEGTGLVRIQGNDVTVFNQPSGGYNGRNLIHALYEDRAGAIWMGHQSGITCFKEGEFTHHPAGGNLPGETIQCMAEGRSGDMWFGSEGGGLVRLREGRFETFTESDGLPSNAIRSLLADADGTLWIGTHGGGLACYKDGRFSHCSMEDGLPDKVINCILEDDFGCFWMTSYRGIIRVARAELEAFVAGRGKRVNCSLYGERDGLESCESAGKAQPAGWKGREGRLWFPMLKGLSVVDPKTIASNPVPPPIVLQEIRVNGKIQTGVPEAASNRRPSSLPAVGGGRSQRPTVETGSRSGPAPQRAAQLAAVLRPPGEIVVPPGDHRLEINYAALSLLQPERNRYKYRLDGFDEDWIDAGVRRRAEYSKLPPGRYQFRVIGSNNDGVWNETGASLDIVLHPFLWQRGWFITLCAVVLIGGSAGAIRHLELRRVRRKMEALEHQVAVSKERSRIARDIHDDLGARLTQIGLLSELARRTTATPEETLRQVEKIANRTRTAVQAMDEIVWAADPTKDTLDHLAAYLAVLTQELFEDAPMRCQLDIPDLLPPHPLSAEVRHNLLLAVKESLHNALKHSAATQIRLQLTLEEGLLTLTIQDNGRGFDRARLPVATAGNGLTNMEQRLRSIGGEFNLESRPGEGTRIVLRMKIA